MALDQPLDIDLQKELEGEREFIRALLDAANSLVICLDKNANITVFNAECERVTGYRREDVLGRSWPEIFLPEGHHHHSLKDFAQWVREHPRDTYEGPIKTKSGQIRTILWSNTAIFSKDSDDLTAIAVGHDITERKRTEDALQEAYDELEKRVAERTTELVMANEELTRQVAGRRKVEEALRESERRYTMATNAGAVGVWDWNLQTNEMFVDPKLKSMLGYEDHEIRNHIDDWGRHVHPDDADLVMAKANKHLDGSVPLYEVTHRMLHKDGGIRWFLARGTAIRDESGTPIRMIGTDTDITERKQAELALIESEERFRKLSEAAEEGIAIHDNGIIIEANEALARISGRELSEIKGMHAREFTTPEGWRTVEENIVRGHDKPYEVTGVRKNGSKLHCQLVGKPYNYRGKELRVVVFRDITELKEAEEELIRTKQRLDHLLSSSPAIIYSCGPGPDFPTTFISDNVRSRLGYEPQEFYDDPFFWSKQIHPDDLHRVVKELSRIENAKSLSYEYRFRRKDGRYVWIFDELRPTFDSDGKMTGSVGSWFDVTQRKQAENMLKKVAGELTEERRALEEKNIALKQILDHIDGERREYQQHICQEIAQAVGKFLKRLKLKASSIRPEEFEALESELKSILEKDIDTFKGKYSKLTSRESEICELIKAGMSSKQVSRKLNLSLLTVHKHREQIRRKLGITNQRVNLATYLRSF
jgi:PAS domain S-box-containing protein